MARGRSVFFLLFLLTVASLGAGAAELPDEESVALNSLIEYLEDPRGQLSVEDVRRPGVEWMPVGGEAFNQGYSASAWWLRLRLSYSGDGVVERLLELSYAVLDYVDIYVYSDGRQLQHYILGDKYPFYERPIEHRFFVIPVTWRSGESREIYYRIKTSTAVQAPISIKSPQEFQRTELMTYMAQGIYFGAMAVIAVYNLLIFFSLWDKSYLYYVTFVLAFPLFLASMSGQAYHFLWPQAIVWNDRSIPIFLGIAFGSSALFALSFLSVGQWSQWCKFGLSGVAAAAIGCAIMSLVVPYSIAIHVLVPLGLFACLFEIVVGLLALRKGIFIARYYLVAWIAFLCGGVLLALNKLNVLPTTFFTEYSIQFGSVLEAVLLSLALAVRIQADLESKVNDRTVELEKVNRRLEKISYTDELTALSNRRYLEIVLQEECARAMRRGSDIAVLMLDLDFFKDINDSYGHLAGDSALKQVAERIQQAVYRPSDKPFRYGGEEFCLVLPETDIKGAVAVAERIRAAVAQRPIDLDAEAQISMTVSVGIALLKAGEQLAPQQMLDRADRALYQSKISGRNRVMVFSDAFASNITRLPVRRSRDTD